MSRTKLQRQLNDLRRAHQNLRNEISSLSEEGLSFRPGGDRWSVLEVLQHLYLSESLSLRYIQKKSQAPDRLTPPSIKSRFQEWAIVPFLKYAPKYKAPTLVSRDGFREDFTYGEAIKTFDRIHDDFESCFTDFPDKVINNNVYRHPFMGRVRLNGMMRFHIHHLGRHRKQIHNNIKEFNKQPQSQVA